MKLFASGTAVVMVLIGGCAVDGGTPGLGDDAGLVDLSGLTLLESGEAECDGIVQVDSANLEGDGEGLGGGFVVEAGQNAVFEFEEAANEDIDWACVGDDGRSDVANAECPDGTSHVRVTRARTGGEVLFECYGAGA